MSGYSIIKFDDAAEGGSIVFRVTRNSSARNRFGSVRFTTSEPFGSPTKPGLDYVPVDRIISFQPGQMFVDVSVQTLNDTELESSEYVNASLSLTGSSRLDTISVRSASARIFDRTPAPTNPTPAVVTTSPTAVTTTSPGATAPAVTTPATPTIVPQPATPTIVPLPATAVTPTPTPAPAVTTVPPGARGVTYAISKLSDANEGDSASVRITRSDATTTGSVRFFTQSGSATSPTDFANKDEIINFAAGQLFVDTTVATLRDVVDEGVETFTANISLVNSLDTVSVPSASVNINNQQPAASYAISKLNDVIEGAAVVLRITRTDNTATAGQVRFFTQPGSALSPADFAAQDTLISFAPGQTFTDVTVTTVADTIEEPPENFTAAIAAANGVDRMLTPSVAVNIANASVASSYAVTKIADVTEGQDLVFRITRSRNVSNLGSVRVLTQSGTAESPADYQSLDQTLTFQPGQTSLDVVVKTARDFVKEAAELLSCNLQLLNPIDSLDGASATASLLDYLPTSTFSISKLNDASEGSDVVFRIVRSGDVEAADSVRFVAQSAKAVVGVDFVAKDQTVSFAPGQTSADISVATLKDAVFEGAETFSAALTSDSAADVIAVGSASATILNVLPGSAYSIQKLKDADEGGQLSFRVTRTGALDRPGSVRFLTQADSALADVDFKSSNNVLLFAPGESSVDVKIDALSDSLAEPKESLYGTLAKINDNDDLSVSSASAFINNVVLGATYSVAKVDDVIEGGDAVFTIERSGYTTVASSVRIQSIAGTARAGTDFEGLNTLVNFGPGETKRQVSVRTREDRTNEMDETFTVALSVLSGVDKLAVGSVEASIKNKLVGSSFNLIKLQDASEGGQVKFRINRSGDTQAAASVQFFTKSDIAKMGSDFVAADRLVEFAPGELSADISIDTIEDADNEQTEIFTGNLAAIDPIDTIGTVSAEAAIANVVPFSKYEITAQGDAREGSNAEFLIKRSGNLAGPSSVQFLTVPGSAESSIDYTSVNKVIKFKPAEASRVVTVLTRADRLREPTEMFTGVIKAIGDNDVIINAEAEMNIANVDLGYAYSIVRVSDAREGSDVRFRIERTGNKNLSSLVRFFTKPGSAAKNIDFQPFDASVEFRRGQSVREISVATVRDSRREPDEFFTGQLATLNPSDSLLTSSMKATIINVA